MTDQGHSSRSSNPTPIPGFENPERLLATAMFPSSDRSLPPQIRAADDDRSMISTNSNANMDVTSMEQATNAGKKLPPRYPQDPDHALATDNDYSRVSVLEAHLAELEE